MPPKSLILLLLSGLLTACGFHLRGSQQIDPANNPIWIQGESLTEAQLELVRRGLKRMAAKLVDTPGANHLRVRFSPLSEQRITRSGSAEIELVQLELELTFSLESAAGEAVIESRSLRSGNTLELDTGNILSADTLREQERVELERELVRQMLHQLR